MEYSNMDPYLSMGHIFLFCGLIVDWRLRSTSEELDFCKLAFCLICARELAQNTSYLNLDIYVLYNKLQYTNDPPDSLNI